MITKRDLLIASLAACTTLAGITLAQSGKPLMKSSVFDWTAIEAKATKTGARRDFFDAPTATTDKLECHVTTINPGEAPHAPHQHPEEELMIIKEGTIEVTQNGVIRKAGPGSVLFQASNEMHGVRNVGQTPATYHVIKWYSPGSLKPKP
jgi:XRE family transcriptional regulator, regulator of sulfur utilization